MTGGLQLRPIPYEVRRRTGIYRLCTAVVKGMWRFVSGLARYGAPSSEALVSSLVPR